MAKVYALIPARIGSKGIPLKNFKPLAGRAPVFRAIECTKAVVEHVIVSSDGPFYVGEGSGFDGADYLLAPAPLHTDTCPMIDVVKDALARVPGEPDDIWLLVQPTQPLREPKHLQAAITLLQESQADSVVSVVELPRTHHPAFVCKIVGEYVQRCEVYSLDHVGTMRGAPPTRQCVDPVYIRDGTVYAFRRRTVERFGDIYGDNCRPLIIPASETQPLDTLEDWAEAERRIREREALAHR